MKTLSSALLTELGLTITRPGHLVEIGFSVPLRLSTLGEISWGGNTWIAADVQVSGIRSDGTLAQSGSLRFANTFDDFGAAILNEGIADRSIKVYAVYAGAPDDAVLMFDGVGDEASWDAQGRVTIRLAQSATHTSFWPRRRINAASGFNHLIAAGTRITIGGQPYILERGR
jgi:hypothetical protein